VQREGRNGKKRKVGLREEKGKGNEREKRTFWNLLSEEKFLITLKRKKLCSI